MRAIDTNVLVRLITRDHAKQTEAAEKFVQKGAWVSLLALTECIWVLGSAYNLPDVSLAKAIEMLLAHEHLAIQDADVVKAALALYQTKPSLGFSDCLMLHIAKKAGHKPFGTFDKDLSKCDDAQKI